MIILKSLNLVTGVPASLGREIFRISGARIIPKIGIEQEWSFFLNNNSDIAASTLASL